MASRNFLDEGLDLTGLAGDATNAQILQSIRESVPATDLGWHIKSETTPDVATYPEYATFLWTKPSTNETKYWNGSSWQLISTAVSISDGSVVIAKLSVTGGSATQLIRVNAGGTAFEFVDAADIIGNNSLGLAKLVNAAGAGYVLYSGGGGVWSTSLFTTLFDTTLNASDIPVARLKDVATTGLLDQVLRRKSDGTYEHEYSDQLLRANQVATDRLQFAGGSAGKYPKVNATGTDFDYVSSVGITAAIVKYTGVTNTAAQTLSATTETTVQFNAEVDVDNIVSTSSHQITLATGTYLLELTVPVHITSPGSDSSVILMIRDVTAANAILATATDRMSGGSNTGDNNTNITLKHVVKITASTNVYDFRIYATVACNLGVPANVASYAETYQQLLITKLA